MNVLMFHSVGNDKSTWSQNWLSASLSHLENFCKYLKKKDFQTLFLDEWYDLQNSPELITNKQILLTFDDGYLDNWIFAYPILKKYGLKGTIFVNPEFVDPSTKIRKINDDQNSLGFLNWAEIQFMDSTETIDIQSHSMSHNYYFTSDKIIDFYQGQDKYHWLGWIKKPERKPFWITENQKDFISEGYPIFEFGRALGLRRFISFIEFTDLISEKFREYKFMSIESKKRQLEADIANYKKKNGSVGRYETDIEMEDRFRYELFESKRILEKKLNKKVDFLCWPGGGYNDLSIKLSVEAGYKASTLASRDKHKTLDNSGSYKRIQRYGIGSLSVFEKNGKRMFASNPNHLIYRYYAQTGHPFYKNLHRAQRLASWIQKKCYAR